MDLLPVILSDWIYKFNTAGSAPPALRSVPDLNRAQAGETVPTGALTFQTFQPIFRLMSNSSAAQVSVNHSSNVSDGPAPSPAIAAARNRFSSLRDGFVYLDAPGGTQTPDEVAAAVAEVLLRSSGNTGAPYATSRRLEALVDEARAASASFLGCTFDEVIFGANMTSLNFTLSRTLGRQ